MQSLEVNLRQRGHIKNLTIRILSRVRYLLLFGKQIDCKIRIQNIVYRAQ